MRFLLALLAASLALGNASAQQAGKVARVVVVIPGTPASAARNYDAFVRGLEALGYTQGGNLDMKVRYAEGNSAIVPALLRAAAAERPDVIVTVGAAAALHAKGATGSIPVVVATASDLVAAGAVRSLARPDGNITGLSDMVDQTTAKRVELTRELLPAATRIALLIDPAFPAAKAMEKSAFEVASARRFELVRLYARDRNELTELMSRIGNQRLDALVVGGSSLHTTFAKAIIDAAAASRVPVIHYWPGTAEAGALASLGPNVREHFRRAASYVDRILKGARPSDLPIEQPTTFELVINLKTARTLGINVPAQLLLRADRVID